MAVARFALRGDLRARRGLRLHAAALLFFALLALICLFPLLAHYRIHAAGYDYFFYHWAFWWTRHALTTPGLSVYESNFVMFPNTANYGFNALTLSWFPVWAMLEPLIGTLAAVTAIIFVACVLNGYLMFAWLRDERIAPGLALIGGAALQLFPLSRYFYYNTHLNLMNWFWIPAHLLVWKRVAAAADTGRIRRLVALAGLQGIGLWGVALADLQFPIFVGFALGSYGLLTLWRAQRRARLIAAGLIALAVALILLWFAGPLPHLLSFEGEFTPSPVEERPSIKFPNGFVSMSGTWWDWATPSLGAFVTLGTLASLIYAFASQRIAPRRSKSSDSSPLSTRWGGDLGEGLTPPWFWLLVALPPFLIALGPTLRLGDTDIPLPFFRLLYDITDGNFRMPWRMGPLFAIAALVFIGKVWTRALAGRVFPLAGLFFLLAADLRLYETGPLRPILPAYQIYATMGREPYDNYVVVEAPTGAGTGEVLLGDPEAIVFQYYGITHRKRMVNGFISRAPVDYFWWLRTDDPMMAWLGQRQLLDAGRVAAQLRERIFDWPIGYIVVHQEYARRNGAQSLEITGYFNTLDDLLCPPIVEGDAVFYRTQWHPDGCDPRLPPETAPGVYTVDIGSSGDERYLGWGWHWQEDVVGITLRWAGDRPRARLYVDLPPGDYDVTLSMQAFAEPRQVTLSVDGTALGGEVTVSDAALEAYAFDLPADLVGDGQHLEIALAYDGWLVPAEIGQSDDQRRLSVMVDWIQFRRIGGE